ncbi:DUF1624 domain-containing protein [Candidatus Peregrinibacteria bacterium]|nr:MAG: DUF1624 domain-containing protein [Candidatus Peregrinibacteria bacterium]
MEIPLEKTQQHFRGIDALRGTAVLGMIIFHFFFILDFLDVLNQQMYGGGWLILARFVQFAFLGLVGVSLALSKKDSNEQFFRGIKILGLGLLVTLTTYIFIPGHFVLFGILHLIGTCIIVLTPLRKHPYIALAFGICIIVLSKYITTLRIDFEPFYILGLQTPVTVSAIDYFPIFPWIGVVLLGVFVGCFLKNKMPGQPTAMSKYFKPLLFLGRRSLLIYMIHVPLIIAILILTNVLELGQITP